MLELLKNYYKGNEQIRQQLLKFDFKRQMLVFGINDRLASRAFQLLKQDWSGGSVVTLDYYDTGIRYRLALSEKGKKCSYMQVFLLQMIDGIRHVRVKDLLHGGLSKVYGEWCLQDKSNPGCY